MKDEIKMDIHSMNIKEEQKEKLKQLFPEVFNEEKIDFDKLKLSLGEDIDVGRERYSINWPGKAQAVKVAQLPSLATLKPDEKASVDFDKTKNLFIEGDNLEVLKLLQKSYFGKIKMIYLDPPYNTGKEFIYPDKYEEGLQTYLQYTGQIDAEGRKFSTNVETDGRFHSKWMNMMWPRLFLARNLLTEDGVIFISIDDHEADNLKKICNEIMGEENFIGQFIVNSTPNARDYGHIGKMHEYTFFYAKNILYTETQLLPDEERSFRFEDSIGPFNIHPLYNSNVAFTPENRKNLYYPFYLNTKKIDKDGFFEIILEKKDGLVEIFPPMSEKGDAQFVWRWGKIKSQEGLNKEIVGYRTGDGDFRIVQKMRHSAKLIRSLLLDTAFSSRRGTAEIEELFGKKIFSFPKPVKLIKDFIQVSTKNNDIILDFFSGSATTAHAVLQLNAEDGESRRFIMTQLPEKIDEESEAYKAGYKNITEIGEDRIRKAGKKIVEENKNKEGFNAEKFDKGFKVFKLDKSNFSVWDGASDGDIQKKLELHVDNTDPKSKEEDILYEILVKAGFELSEKIEQVKVGGRNVYSVLEGQLLICLDKLLDKDFVRSLAEKKPKQFICLNSSFKEDADLTNTAKILENNQIEFRTI